MMDRLTQDHLFLEVSNSPHERTALALTFCALLPVVFLKMDAARFEFAQPLLVESGTKVRFVEDESLMTCCHFLRAMKAGYVSSARMFLSSKKEYIITRGRTGRTGRDGRDGRAWTVGIGRDGHQKCIVLALYLSPDLSHRW